MDIFIAGKYDAIDEITKETIKIVAIDLKLISPIRRGLVHMGGKGYVNGQVCIEADMLAQVVKDREEK